MQEHVFIDVPRPGNMLAVRGGYTRMRLCRQCHRNGSHESQTPSPPTGLQTAWPEKNEKFRFFFSRSKVVLPVVPAMFFFTKIFRAFFTVLPEGFFKVFRDFFRTFFRTIFRTVFLAEFFARPFYAFF